jgi:hypothetical protein
MYLICERLREIRTFLFFGFISIEIRFRIYLVNINALNFWLLIIFCHYELCAFPIEHVTGALEFLNSSIGTILQNF